MPATTKTTEKFDKAATREDDIKGLVQLRIQAGAIRSIYRTEGNNWVIETEWNVIGQQ